MKRHYGKSRAPTAVSMQSICARVHLQSGIFAILLYFQRNQFKSKSNKIAVDRRQQLHGNVVTTARRFDTRRINSSSTLEPYLS